jgi:hypothetical protein
MEKGIMTNTLAYYFMSSITAVKRFIVQASDGRNHYSSLVYSLCSPTDNYNLNLRKNLNRVTAWPLGSTMVEHSPHYPKVKGLSPAAGVGGTEREIGKKSWANVVKLSCGSYSFIVIKGLLTHKKKFKTE